MMSFPNIEEVHIMLDEIAEEIPKDFFKELNEGIVLLSKYKIHPDSKHKNRLYILGEYKKSFTGRHIAIYYGSFREIYINTPKEDLREKLKDILLHEFTHHLESLAGEKGLEIKDKENLNSYKNNKTL